jgi:hypothetical protein
MSGIPYPYVERGVHHHLSSDDFSSWSANHVGCKHKLSGQLMFLGECFTDEIMTSSQIKQDDDRMSIQRKHTHEDLLAPGNILYGSVVDAAGLRHDHLLWTTWWRGDVALRDTLLRRGALMSEVA